MPAATSGVRWSTRPERNAGSALPPWCAPPCGGTTAAYGTSCACWSSSGAASSSGVSALVASSHVGGRHHGLELGDSLLRHEAEEARQLAWRSLDDRAPPLEERGGLARVEGHEAQDDVADRVGVELEARDDPEVPARPANGPEQIRVRLGVGAHLATVGEDELGGDDVVDRQAVFAAQEADAAGRGQAPDADVAVIARAHPEPVRLQDLGDLAPAGPGPDADFPAVRVDDLDAVELADVEHDPAVVGRPPADAVAAAADGERHVLLACVGKRLGDLLGSRRTQDEPRRAAAEVRRAHARVGAVAGLNRLDARGNGVVVDARAALGERLLAADRTGRGAGAAALALDRGAERRGDFLAVRLDRARVVAAEDEGAEAVLEDVWEQLLDPVVDRRRKLREVEQPQDLARVAAGRHRRFVDRLVGPRDADPASVDVGEAREPPVGLAGEEAQRPRLVCADPDRDVVGRLGAALGSY